MIDHVELKSRDVEASKAFYEQVLKPLGYERRPAGNGIGFADGTGFDFFLVAGEPPSDVHFAFRAGTRDQIDEIYENAGSAGFTLDRAPALAPHIHPNYYAGYLRDPDGRLVEFVCHAAV